MNDSILNISMKSLKLVLAFFLLIMISELLKLAYSNLMKYEKRKKYTNSRISEIYKMSGQEFEGLLEAHFHKLGYKTQLTKTTNDYGADLILKKGDTKIVVQAKRYQGKVGNKAVQEIIGAIGYYKANEGMVITNSYFTDNAKKLAEANNIVLWDRNSLIQIFRK